MLISFFFSTFLMVVKSLIVRSTLRNCPSSICFWMMVSTNPLILSSLGSLILLEAASTESQIINTAVKYRRKVAFGGRSMVKIAEIGRQLGLLHVAPEHLVDIDKIKRVPDGELVIISTGSQGEQMSALSRMAAGEYNKIRLGANDTVIISASPIPGTR